MASAIFSPPADWWKKMGDLEDRLAHAQYKLESSLAINATLVSDAAKAADAQAAAEKRAVIARQLVEQLRSRHTKSKMDDAEWDANVDLQERFDARGEELAELEQLRQALKTECSNKDKELADTRATIEQLRKSETSLERELAASKEKLQQQASDAKDIRANLDAAYADVQNKDAEYASLQKQKDAADAAFYAVQLELKDAREHYQNSQKRVEELESQKSAIEALEQSNAMLQADHDSLQALLDDRDREILVKDARILLLETQVQKALAAERKAVDEATKAEPAADLTTGLFASAEHTQDESLKAEIGSQADSDDFQGDGAGDDIDLASEPEISLGFSAIQTIEITPADAATTAASAQTIVSSSQIGTTSTQTDAPKLTQAATETILQYAPTVHEERHVETQTLSTGLSDRGTMTDTPDEIPSVAMADQDTQTDAQAETPRVTLVDDHTQTNTETQLITMSDCGVQTDPQPAPTPAVARPKKNWKWWNFFFWLFAFLTVFFAYLSLELFIAKEDWRLSNNRHGVNRMYNSLGYKQRGRHLFGHIPVCYENHSNVVLESMCEHFTDYVKKAERYLGGEPKMLW